MKGETIMNWARRYLSIILILSLTGCATNPIDLSKAKAVPMEEAVVFGRVNIIHKNEPKVWGKLSSPGGFYISVLPGGSSEAFSHTLREDGSFYWHLRPGDYTIAGLTWERERKGFLSSGWEKVTGRIFANFKVAEGGSLNYIGTLTIVFEDKGYRYFMRVEEDFDQASKVFSSKFPNIKGEAVKNLMQLEKGP
jgi:hypothetical protein